MQVCVDIASEKGSSSWLTVLPMAEHGFALHKGAFRDAIHLRYGWKLSSLPSLCVCGKSFTVDHAFSCPYGAFRTIRHNEIRDIFADVFTEVCSGVGIEPVLQPLSGNHYVIVPLILRIMLD